MRRTGYIIVTSKTDEADILTPSKLEAVLRLWGIIQSFTIDNEEKSTNFDKTLMPKKTRCNSCVNYSAMCVKLPIPSQISNIVETFLTETEINKNFSNSETNGKKK